MSNVHLAILIGPRAHAQRDVLREMLPSIRTRLVPDVYALADDGIIDASSTWWIDGAQVGERELGVLQFLRRRHSDVLGIVLDTSNDAPPGDAILSELRALGLHVLADPPSLDAIRALVCPADEPNSTPEHAVIAGIADQIANPLAALAARLQLCELALGSSAEVDFEDNLALARETTKRISSTLEKLRMMTAHGIGTRAEHDVLDLFRRQLENGDGSAKTESERVVIRTDAGSPTAWIDATVFEQAMAALLRTSLDLSPDGIEIVAYDRAVTTLVELRFESPLAVALRDDEDVFAPFALNRNLRDPDLGLDLALARALITSCSGTVRAIRHSGFLEGFELRVPGVLPEDSADPED